MVQLNNNEQCLVYNFGRSLLRRLKKIFLITSAIVVKTGIFLLHAFCLLFYFGRGKVVPPIKNDILLKSATKLAADIREGKLKSETVIQAFIDRIREVEPYINATTYQRFSEAIQEARQVDETLASRKWSKTQLAKEKPLLGVPISVKELIKVKGMPFTGGSIDGKNIKATEDADVITFMKKAGAIVLVGSNVPEKGLGMETYNKLYGRTDNPYDTSRSVCGSSGGEAALVASGASIMGLGNDTAGSLRMPSLFCGIYGHNPTIKLVSQHGQFAVNERVTTIGPLCRYAEDLTLAMKVLTMDKGNAISNKQVNFNNLKIYYVTSMGSSFSVSLDKEIKEALVKVLCHFDCTYGVKAKEVNIPLLHKTESIFLHNIISDTGTEDDIKKSLQIPSEISPSKELLKLFLGISKYTLIVPFLLNFLSCPLWYKESKVPLYKNLLKQLKQEFDDLLDENSVFLCPTLPRTGLHHLEPISMAPSLSYVAIWNYLSLPATHCPLGLNRKGLPLGIQIISSRNNDSLNFAIAEELENAFGGWVQPGKTVESVHD